LVFGVNDANFDQVVLKSDKPVLVRFWASWSGPCKQVQPIFAELAELPGGTGAFGFIRQTKHLGAASAFSSHGWFVGARVQRIPLRHRQLCACRENSAGEGSSCGYRIEGSWSGELFSSASLRHAQFPLNLDVIDFPETPGKQ
jgi:Thioredoxin